MAWAAKIFTRALYRVYTLSAKVFQYLNSSGDVAMDSQTLHSALVDTTLDEFNLQSFTAGLRMFLLNDIGSGMRKIYEEKVKPHSDHTRNYSREPVTDVHDMMLKERYTRFYSTFIRTNQEMI